MTNEPRTERPRARRARRRTRAIAVLLAAVAAALVVVALVRVDLVSRYRDWRLGYRVRWTPAGVVPSYSRSGQLAVGSRVAVDLVGGDPSPRAAIWHAASGEVEPIDLGEIAGVDAGTRSRAGSMHDAGFVIGTLYRDENHLARGWLWSRERGAIDLGSLGGSQIAPIAVNGRGEVVGWAATPNGRHAFVWTRDGGLIDLGVAGYASAISELGLVVGTIEDRGAATFEPFLWTREAGVRRLGFVDGFTLGEAADVNSRGEILVNFLAPKDIGGGRTRFVATSYVFCERTERSERRERSEGNGYRPLPRPPAGIEVRGAAIDAAGTVLLASHDASAPGPAYLVRAGRLVDLPEMPGSERTHWEALAPRGVLLGRALVDGEWRGFVAEPVR